MSNDGMHAFCYSFFVPIPSLLRFWLGRSACLVVLQTIYFVLSASNLNRAALEEFLSTNNDLFSGSPPPVERTLYSKIVSNRSQTVGACSLCKRSVVLRSAFERTAQCVQNSVASVSSRTHAARRLARTRPSHKQRVLLHRRQPTRSSRLSL